MLDVNFFDELRIGLATAEDIRQWSHGEVKKPETINYRTLKPEKDGLFCEKIFGPTRDWECYCGKYKRIRFKGIICERCGVEVTRSKVRRERMGHIELAAAVTHIWYFKGVPSRLGYLLDIAPKDLEKIIYFAAYVITSVDSEARHRDLATLENEIAAEKRQMENGRDAEVEKRAAKLEADLAELEAEGAKADVRRKVKDGGEREMRQIRDKAQREIDRLEEVIDTFRKLEPKQLIGDEMLFRELHDRFGEYFTGSMGAEAVKELLANLDLTAELENLRDIIANGKGQKKIRALKRLKVVAPFATSGSNPMGMVLDCVPVIPPELRPMVQLDGGRFATSDLNDLYRRVINRNNRLKRLIDLGAPEIIVANEKRMLQESVDALFDNGRRGRPVTGPGNRPLKSLSDMLKGKQGRFRQNLLGKRVDYSGRSVIVVGPQLKLHQCGLPKQMALELFKPFVMKRLVDLNHAQNIKSAKRMVERARPAVWDVLEEVITEHPVLLNRAPTLHRLGIQAFEPQLVEGKAIQIHPLVCTAFNADFDGDQMAVHVPLSTESQAEARILMLSANNILKPSDGRPVTMPTQDMIIGLYHLTHRREGLPGEGRAFSSVSEAMMAYDRGELHLQAPVAIRVEGVPSIDTGNGPEPVEDAESTAALTVQTTLGRVIFNEALPTDYRFVNYEVRKGQLSEIVNDLAERYTKVQLGASLDALKAAGFHWATWSGITIGYADVVGPKAKAAILERHEKDADRIEKQYQRGLMTAEERRGELIEIWTKATNEIAKEMDTDLPQENPLWQMINSGARGNMLQLRQIAAIRGLVANPKGEIIPRPIKSSYREGLTVLEYFISTHGSRKGLADTALRTADSGYLTRRLVDVSQDVIVREEDCETERAVRIPLATEVDGQWVAHENAETSVYARTLAEDLKDAKGKLLAAEGVDLTQPIVDILVAAGVKEVRVRSVLTCESQLGVCAACYGRSMPTGQKVDMGEAVGIIAAQSIGEPGTQLTMRTFHTGGVAGDDITQGLPRVQEIFEARIPKGKAPIAEAAGTVRIEDADKSRKIIITPDDGTDEIVLDKLSRRTRLRAHDGDHIGVGEKLTEGTIDPHELLRVLGPRQVQSHLVDQVQDVYRSQGVLIHDKHIEIIVRQMLKRVTIIDSGTTEFLPGSLVDRVVFEGENRRIVAEGGEPASGRPQLMGITKASLATDSWLSAASFQETTKVLTDAAINAKSDSLIGLKENVIIGKLIPAGTGISKYRNVRVEPTEEAKSRVYSMGGYEDPVPAFGFGAPSSNAVPLDDFDIGQF
ncbi:DNA-directed RNA polymerase subunit beta' [Stackebrandtia nassauensis]|uniref:DNA-directed RNA polymerase subunit beta' n=1 Tax=Stackebrandtia nassauensis (strain DSM 44728 / CIP 108903 / NRRL B-16338 / NBRC 102104 / LLR-40K-21) TaxID=446470 RepID=D3QB70_STANL|nr:DNA-directed RNA polymerase subunit beta' [Stackebrandtia nassauensis]ADD40887.1 DNA-directed RNA polymerase, beta' subunit [Stackebrandtia nassauensis DSM 44728]